ncbi:MAG TPA: hypothetical protein VLV28_01185 [Gaiellaceae bacterium]|nr:hypothetical protein [Gaiellaceae bacterium]
MITRRLALAALVSGLAFAAVPGGAGAANECNGVPRCIPVEGPWVAVPASGEADYVLSCPQGKGIVAGTDGRASSTDIRATFDGILGSPVASGRTTNSAVLFRAVSAHHRAGLFKPFIGCIPTETAVRNTIATELSPLGAPLDFRTMTVKISPGLQRTVTLSCPAGESLVDSWNATAFGTAKPAPQLASAIQVQTKIVNGRARLAITASEALPAGIQAQVQIGVRCAR